MKNIIIDVALPVYNEEKELKTNTLKLYKFLKKTYGKDNFIITIADNASTDSSFQIAQKLQEEYSEIKIVHLERKGRGRAIKKVWLLSPARVLAYMDLDLSTSLDDFPFLVSSIIENNYDIAVGSRLLPGARIYKRPMLREVLSRGLNILIKIIFLVRFSDAQCGFKAISSKRKNILNYVKDDEWFFDSELLIIAEKSGLRIFEKPVIWIDNPGSTVRVLGTVTGDLLGLLRIFFTRPWNQAKINFRK